MLTRLLIKNIALIDELEIALGSGLNILSGETGAGKSIIVDSVNLALGERADRELIRTGEDKAVVEAWFSCPVNEAVDMLAQQEIVLSQDDDLILSRELNTSGKNICRINGILVPLSLLKQVSDLLVDIHGQHEHQSLLNEKNHINMLDEFGNDIQDAKQNVKAAYKDFKETEKRLIALSGNEGERERRIDLLKYQINEINKAAIRSGEEAELLLHKKRLNSSERIAEALSSVYNQLYEDEENVLSRLKNISGIMNKLYDVDKKFSDYAAKIDEAYYLAEETASAIMKEISENYFDAGELEETEERLALISRLNRKYGDSSIGGDYLKKAEAELEDLAGSEELISKLSAQLSEKKEKMYRESVVLSQRRRQAAEEFSNKMLEQLSDLGMTDASFCVVMPDIPAIDGCVFGSSGIDTVEFYISTNKGEPPKPLSKVASGGEVSRIMLAFKNIAANEGGIPTMIFDEIDTGISGRMAQVVAEKLWHIAAKRQVVCVTHLPQIAAMADIHFLIQKSSDEKSTTTNLKLLSGESRVDEVARLAGGDSSVSSQHAKEMIERADAHKKLLYKHS